MTPLRAGIVGSGRIAAAHARAIDAARDVRLVAVCDLDRERADALAGPHGATAHVRWQAMLEAEELDLLWVATPPLGHRGPAVAALESGLNVYLEKPIARTLEDAAAIVEAAGAAAGICTVGYQWHASELLDAAREALAGQRLGMLVGRNFGQAAARPWFVDQAEGGGQILERASHHIDLQRALAGEVAGVQAFAADVRLSGADGSAIDDAVALVLQFRAGAVGTVHAVWSREGLPGRYAADLLAEEAAITLELGSSGLRIRGVSKGRAIDAAFGDPLERSVARFLEAVKRGDRSLVACPPEDAMRTLAVALACERALADGTRVML
ncbi:MAG TPA: Gfo/Idh/MocA family oxidoreductase [Gaiellales bacterium]|nr:Gfo/Idh/MocA family oxidoreductase [Gaiellales bacterium]